MLKTITIEEVKTKLKAYNNGWSAWSKGVKAYAFELLEEYQENHGENIVHLKELIDEEGFAYGDYHIEKNKIQLALLNGASDWREYSFGGCSLIYDSDIAERLLTPTQRKITHDGEKTINGEDMLTLQARALWFAFRLISKVLNS